MNPMPRFRRARHLLRACDGIAAVEFALLSPVFLLMLLGAVEFGRMLWTQSTLQQAVEAAARCASVSCSGNIPSYAASQMYGMTVSSSVFTLTASPNGNCGGNEVSASLPFTFAAPKLLPWNVTLTAQSCYPAQS